MRVQVEVLTPLHIGDGSVLSPMEYAVHRDKLLVVDADKLLRTIVEQGLFDNFSDALETGAARTLLQLLRQMGVQQPGKLLQQARRYEIGFVGDSQRKPGGPRGVIHAHIKLHDATVYLPGSSLKGALRTAILLEQLARSREARNWLLGKLASLRDRAAAARRNPEKKPNLHKMLRSHLKTLAGELEAELLSANRRDAHFDLLRFMRISDSDAAPPHECLYVAQVRGISPPARTSTADHYEWIRPGTTFSLDIHCREDDAKLLRWLPELDKLGHDPGNASWLESLQRVFAMCHHATTRALQWEFEFVTQWAHDHSSELGRSSDTKAHLAMLVRFIRQLHEKSSPESPIIRLGAAQGLLWTTVSGIVRQADPQLYQQTIAAAAGRGKPKPTFPVSRRLAPLPDGQTCAPPGFVQLRVVH